MDAHASDAPRAASSRAPHRTGRRRLRSVFAAALTAGLAGTMLASATPSSALPAPGESTFVPVVPCRLLDTRPDPAFNVGSRTTPLGPGETHQLAVTGAQGNCAVPDGASAVALNVTGVAPTAASYLTLFPFGADRPTSSNLNLVAGGAPTPNKSTCSCRPTANWACSTRSGRCT